MDLIMLGFIVLCICVGISAYHYGKIEGTKEGRVVGYREGYEDQEDFAKSVGVKNRRGRPRKS